MATVPAGGGRTEPFKMSVRAPAREARRLGVRRHGPQSAECPARSPKHLRGLFAPSELLKTSTEPHERLRRLVRHPE